MPRKPSISPTKLSIYLACPVKYRWTYVDGRGRWYFRSKSYYSFGTTLHKVLERFYDDRDRGVQTTEEVLEAYDEGWIEAGYHSAEEMSEAYGQGRDILERHVERVSVLERESKTLFVERQLKFDMGEFNLIGRLDRVDEYPDGTLEVVDYKTGRETVTPEDVSGDLAMSIYQLLLARKYPDRPIRARIEAVKTGASAVAALTRVELLELESDVLQIGREILTEDFYERRPVPKRLCERCDFLALCRQDPAY